MNNCLLILIHMRDGNIVQCNCQDAATQFVTLDMSCHGHYV